MEIHVPGLRPTVASGPNSVTNAAHARGLHGKIVFIIDDDHIRRDALRLLFEAQGMAIACAANLAEMRDLLDCLEIAPDICIANLCLPDGDGRDGLALICDTFDEAQISYIALSQDTFPARPHRMDAITFTVDSKNLRLEALEALVHTALLCSQSD